MNKTLKTENDEALLSCQKTKDISNFRRLRKVKGVFAFFGTPQSMFLLKSSRAAAHDFALADQFGVEFGSIEG